MATELNEKVGLTKAARDNIKQALYNKTGVTQSDDIRTYANVIANIPTGIDTSDATAAANSILYGKTAYVNGVKITGDMYDIGPNTNGHSEGYIGIAGVTGGTSRTMDYTNSYIKYRMTTVSPTPIVYTNGAYNEIWEKFDRLANVINLTPNILQKNKTVLGITGTLESLDTTDATANSYDIALGQTAYVNGQKLTGNVTTINNGINTYCSNNSILTDIPALNRIQTKCTFSNNIMFREGSELMIDVPYSNFISVNNLTADNIKSGVNLFGITGNYEGGGSNESISIFESRVHFAYSSFVDIPDWIVNANWKGQRSLDHMFHSCNQLKNFTEIPFDDNVTSANNMFRGCVCLENMTNFNTTNIKYASGMFAHVRNIINIPNFNFSNLKNGSEMFWACDNIVNIPDFNFCNLENTYNMFYSCYNIVEVPNFKLGKLINTARMFYDCCNLVNIPNLNFITVDNAYSIFGQCTNLVSVPQFNFCNATDVSYIFINCTNLVSVPQFNICNANDITLMFSYCNNLSDASIQNIINSFLNGTSITEASYKNLMPNYWRSPFAFTNITKSRYQNRWSELSAAGWSY